MEVTPKTLELARVTQASKIGAGDAVRLEVSGAYNAFLLCETQNLRNF